MGLEGLPGLEPGQRCCHDCAPFNRAAGCRQRGIMKMITSRRISSHRPTGRNAVELRLSYAIRPVTRYTCLSRFRMANESAEQVDKLKLAAAESAVSEV